ncbi:MAG: VWD domain-containing protein [Acidobacteriota bacterium]|nr:MAG: VWD domain-containing protein [Acidobacteriota bacterium]
MDSQKECNDQEEGSFSQTRENGEPIPESRQNEYDPQNGCEIFKGWAGVPRVLLAYFPNGHPRCFGVTGEPHLSTYDDVRFDFQAAGEFIATKSLDDNFEVQMRLEPYAGLPDRISVLTGIAVRLGPHRVSVRVKEDQPLRVDGEVLELQELVPLELENAGALLIREGRRYSIVLADGTNVHTDLFSSLMNLYISLAEERDGRMAGIAGNGDGDNGSNDFHTREGEPLSSPPEFETLYEDFAESWRISQKESLFDYRQGESTQTFMKSNVPVRPVTVKDILAADRARAEERCRAAGIQDPDVLEECIFDFALTGDEVFIESALSMQMPPDLLPEEADVEVVTLDAPTKVIASFPIEINARGPTTARDLVCIAPAGSEDRGRCLAQTSPGDGSGSEPRTLKLNLPNESGTYELRYLVRNPDLKVQIRHPLEVRDPIAHIEAPETAPTGGDLDVTCVGECSPNAYMNLVPAGSPDDVLGKHAYMTRGPKVKILRVPKEPGAYELRYFAHSKPRRVFARKPIQLE